MSKQVTTHSPKLFIGLDIHKKTWKLHFTTDLVEGSGHTFPPDTQKIKSYVERNYPQYEISVAYEVGCCGYEPARDFISFDWDTFVIQMPILLPFHFPIQEVNKEFYVAEVQIRYMFDRKRQIDHIYRRLPSLGFEDLPKWYLTLLK